MKITGMVLVGENEPYLHYSINSIKDIVDDIVVFRKYGKMADLTCMEIPMDVREKTRFIMQKEGEVDFAKWRNEMLDDMRKHKTDWVLFLDADEIFANSDGSPVTRKQLLKLFRIKFTFKEEDKEKKYYAEVFDIFTRHFMWNYFTIDATKGGFHHSSQRLFKIPKKPIEIEFQRKVHEVMIWYKQEKDKKYAYFPKHVGLTPKRLLDKVNPTWSVVETENDKMPTIWHFGHCKGIEDLRGKYATRGRIEDNPWFADRKGLTDDEYCAKHPKINGTLPCIHYAGKLPEVMKLW